ncbi:hypothetical protein WKW80_22750 [Variovorax humicola]|uniref:TelA-like protein n=1 Tax=Variovorax humicola TaxID=1769758 RepID=A0ABU8W4K2_9BURK
MSSDAVTSSAQQANAIVVLDKVTYDVIAGPPGDSALVQIARDRLVQSLKIDQIVSGLERSDDLLNIAACGVSGFRHPDTKVSLLAMVIDLQAKLGAAADDMRSALVVFGESSGVVLGALGRAFRFLYRLQEDKAVNVLKRCEQIAKEMTTTASQLETRFQGMSGEALEVLKATVSTRDFNHDKKLEAEARQRKAEERHDRMLKLSEKIAEQLPKVESRYEEAKAAQATADTRVFIMGLTSSIMQGIGSGISAGLALKTAPLRAGTELAAALAESRLPTPQQNKAGNPPSPVAPPPAAPAPVVDDKARVAAEEAVSRSKASLESAQAALREASARYAKAIEDSVDVEEVQAQHKAAEEKHKSAKESLAKAEADLLKLKGSTPARPPAPAENSTGASVVSGVGQALQTTGESLGNSTDGYAQIASNYAKEKAKYLDMLMALQKEQRDALAEVAELTKQMQNEGVTADLAQAAVDSLQQAIGALREIHVIVGQLRKFWTAIALGCKNLSRGETTELITDLMDQPEAMRIKDYSAGWFQLDLLQLSAKWMALQIVCNEYSTAIEAVGKKMDETFMRNPSIEEARKLAKSLSADLAKKIGAEVKQLDVVEKDIQLAKDDTDRLKIAA